MGGAVSLPYKIVVMVPRNDHLPFHFGQQPQSAFSQICNIVHVQNRIPGGVDAAGVQSQVLAGRHSQNRAKLLEMQTAGIRIGSSAAKV